jgi:hypothetical protein
MLNLRHADEGEVVGGIPKMPKLLESGPRFGRRGTSFSDSQKGRPG